MRRLLIIATVLPVISSCSAGGNTYHTVTIRSAATGRTLKYGVLVPRDYAAGLGRYPTVFLLHGLGGNHALWRQVGVERVGVRDRVIFVLADVGNSWYFNWPDADDGQRNRWEDYIVGDLLPDVDARFRTDPSRRAVCGYSMGGYGAVVLALRHPDLFAAAAAISGPHEFPRELKSKLVEGRNIQIEHRERLSREADPAIGVPGFSSQDERTPRSRLPEAPEFYDAHDPFSLLAGAASPPALVIASGIDDSLMDQSRRLVAALEARQARFTWLERPGGHSHAFLEAVLPETLDVLLEMMQSGPQPRP